MCAECGKTTAPVDGALGLNPRETFTWGVARRVAYAGAISAFAGAEEVLEQLADIRISSSHIDRLSQEHGARIEQIGQAEQEAWLAPVDPVRETPEPDVACERQVLQADATCVLTVAGEEHKSVNCATVFDLESRGRSGQRPFIANRLYSAGAYDMAEFGPRLAALAWRGGMRRAEQTAFIADGARCLWKWAEGNLPEGTVFIQDFWHVCEHLSHLAQNLEPNHWHERFARWKAALRAGEIDTILAELRAEHNTRRGSPRQEIREQITYLESGRHRMDYARYERAGWPIGSGAIEGTCKHLVKERFGVTGAQWRRANIPQILALRVAIFNQDWERYWEVNDAA